jgi:hypothetical protein
MFFTGSPSIAVFTEQGEFIRAFGEQFAGSAHGYTSKRFAVNLLKINFVDKVKLVMYSKN